MAAFADFAANLRNALAGLIQKNYSDFANQAQSDIQSFLTDANEDLVRWTGLLANKSIDQDDFELLVRSDADLLEMHALKQAGLAEARWDLLVNSVIQTVVSVAVKTFI